MSNTRLLLSSVPIGLALLFSVACNSNNYLSQITEDPTGAVDDSGNPVVEGPQPDIKVEPDVLSFGYLPPGCTPETQEVIVTNVGENPLEVSKIELNGTAQGSFQVNVPSMPILQTGESFTFNVQFQPTGYSDYEAIVNITSNDPDEAIYPLDTTGHGSDDARSEDTFIQPTPEAVDVLWVIDNSCSMQSTVDTLNQELGAFISNFTSLGLDYRLAAVTTDMEDPAQSGQFRPPGIISPAIAAAQGTTVEAMFAAATNQGFDGSPDEKGRDAAYAALTPPISNGANAGFIRPDAHLSIIVVSDEEDSSDSISTGDFSAWLNGLKGDPDKTSFSGMVGPEWGGNTGGCSGLITPTSQYPAVINATGGLHTVLCNMDFQEVLTYLSYYAAGMSADFPLSTLPSNTYQIKVTVDGVSINFSPLDGWNYDEDTNAIVFSGNSVPGPNAVIVITYPVPVNCN